KAFDELAAESYVESIGTYEPAYKMSPSTGRIPLIERARAKSPDIDLLVSLWSDADAAAARAAVESVAGSDKVTEFSLDGRIQQVEDNGTSCDAVLSGSNTHGNVVAGIIAGAPGDFGLTFSHGIDPSDGVPVGGWSLDALARGARIIMQDAGAPSRCLINELA